MGRREEKQRKSRKRKEGEGGRMTWFKVNKNKKIRTEARRGGWGY